MKTANQESIFRPCTGVACVTAFGAKGDGVADDTAVIQAAPGVFSLRRSEDWRTASGIVVMGSERVRSTEGPGDKWILSNNDAGPEPSAEAAGETKAFSDT